MAKEGKTAVVPRLRFAEFQDANGWQLVPLGEVGQFLRGLTYGASDVSGSGLLVLRSTNIQEGTLVLDRDLVFVSKVCPQDLVLQSGDIAICMSNGSKALVGKSAEYKGGYRGTLTVGAFCSIFRPTIPFAKIAFSTECYADFVALAIGGGNINNLKNSALEAFEFPLPKEHAEQQKIADCLGSLDELIAAQGRKVEALKAYKRGLMQQLFPREGETLPRLRFPEFVSTSAWHSQKIGSLLSKASFAVSVEANQMYREIGIRSHGKGIFHKEPALGKDIGEKRVFQVVQNALVLNIVFAWEQAVATTSENEVGMIASHRFPMYVAKPDKCDVEYVKGFFLTKEGKRLLGVASPGGAGRNKTLGQKEFENLEIALPVSVNEQMRIANCLSSLGSKIAIESDKLAALKTHRDGLMQQLFPSLEEA